MSTVFTDPGLSLHISTPTLPSGKPRAAWTVWWAEIDVVQDASHVYIEIPNEGKKQYKAQVLGICPFFDIAIIRILDYQNTHCCTLDEGIGHSDSDAAVKSGDETYALGFPLGQDNLKVTKGIVSGQQQREDPSRSFS